MATKTITISSVPPAVGGTNTANITNVYSNMKEHILPDLRIHSAYIEEALQAILHTMLFVRAPNDVRPTDASCEKLAPIIYATCGMQDLDNKINTTIELLKRSLIISPSGHHLRGEITLSFYQRKESKGWFQFVSNTEHVYFERWRVPITILDYQPPANSPPSSLTPTGNKHVTSPGMLSASTFSPNANSMNNNTNNNYNNPSQRRHSTGGTGSNSVTGTTGIGFFQTSPTNSDTADNLSHNTVTSNIPSNNTSNHSTASNIDPMKAYLHAYDLVTKAIMFILETANTTNLPILAEQAFFELNVSDAKELRQTAAYLANSYKGLNSNSTTIAAGKVSPMVPTNSSRRF